LEYAAVVSEDPAAARKLRRRREYARALDRPTGVSGENAAGDQAGRRLFILSLRRCVSRRLLGPGTLGLLGFCTWPCRDCNNH
jgi:hypothetical protein